MLDPPASVAGTLRAGLARPPRADAIVLAFTLAAFVALPGIGFADPPSATGTNYALTFDGVDDWVEVPDPLDAPGALTIEAWVKVTDASSWGRIVSNRSGETGYEIDIGTAPELRFTFLAGVVVQTPFTPGFGSWAHVAATWDGVAGEAALYINGSLASSTPTAESPTASAGNMRFGAFGGFSHFNGSIDEVRIWGAALDAATIATWKSTTLDAGHPNWSDLMGYWTFDEGVGQTAASAVNSPAFDGRLGDTGGSEPTDPTWDTDVPTDIDRATFGMIKNRYR